MVCFLSFGPEHQRLKEVQDDLWFLSWGSDVFSWSQKGTCSSHKRGFAGVGCQTGFPYHLKGKDAKKLDVESTYCKYNIHKVIFHLILSASESCHSEIFSLKARKDSSKYTFCVTHVSKCPFQFCLVAAVSKLTLYKPCSSIDKWWHIYQSCVINGKTDLCFRMNLWSPHSILALSDAFPLWASIKYWSRNLFFIFSLMNIYIWK